MSSSNDLMLASKGGDLAATIALLASPQSQADLDHSLRNAAGMPTAAAINGAPDRTDWTAYIDIVKLLLTAGANPNFAEKKDGLTPLADTTCHRHDPDCKMMRTLIDGGADINLPVDKKVSCVGCPPNEQKYASPF